MIKRNTLMMMCGPPRSGKTSFISISDWKDEICISADILRKQILNRNYDAKNEPIIWTIRGIMLRYLMSFGTPIVIDETNNTKKRRLSVIKLAQEFNYKTLLVKVKTTVNQCNRRANNSSRNDLLPVIDRMFREHEPPELSEGIDMIMVVDGNNNRTLKREGKL
jgi:predicted kinase